MGVYGTSSLFAAFAVASLAYSNLLLSLESSALASQPASHSFNVDSPQVDRRVAVILRMCCRGARARWRTRMRCESVRKHAHAYEVRGSEREWLEDGAARAKWADDVVDM